MDTSVNDIRQAAWLQRAAASSLVGLVMAVGIGAGTIVFTVMHASLLNSIPSNAGTLVSLDQTTSKSIPNETLRPFRWESFPSPSHLAEGNSSRHICAFHSTFAPVVKRNVARRSDTLAARARGQRNREVLTTRYQVQKGNGNGQPNKRHPLCTS